MEGEPYRSKAASDGPAQASGLAGAHFTEGDGMKLQFLSCALGITALCAWGAVGQVVPNAGLSPADRTFADDLARTNMAEINLGKLAQQRGTVAAVKDFATRMVRDHTELDNELKSWAASNSVTLPTGISPADMAEQHKLASVSGKAFDDAYMETMLSDHQHDIIKVQREAERVTNPQVKQLASRTLPVLEDHVRLAEYRAGQMGISPKPGLNEPEQPNQRPTL
jgi:putative membrane protein